MEAGFVETNTIEQPKAPKHVNGTKPRTVLRKQRNMKINPEKVMELAKKGLNCSDIARNQGVAVSTITRYLDSIKPQLNAIKQFNSHKADTLSLSQLKNQTIVSAIQDHWLKNMDSNDKENLLLQDIRLQKEVFVAAQGAKTYDFNMERLERGKSTDNILAVHALVAKIDEIEAKEANCE